MKIAVAQTEIRQDDPAYNLQKAERWIAEAAFNQAEQILFPEMSFTGLFQPHLQLRFAAAETIFQRMQTAAKQHRIRTGFGWTSAESDGRGKNHYTILTPDGESCLDYTKIHPFSYCQEDRFFQKGTQLAHATISGIPVSVLICYDLRFPEVFRIAARSAAADFRAGKLGFLPAEAATGRSFCKHVLLKIKSTCWVLTVLGHRVTCSL
ncbi:MAG: nitrilase-related carbon-nitrogen hydrolase [Ruminococcus sp.]